MPISSSTIRALPAFALTLLAGASAPAGQPREIAGHYTVQWEEQSFQPCGSREKWWVSDPGPLMRRYRELVQGRSFGTVYVKVRAEVTEPGQYGHLGMFPRAMAVRELVDARAAGDDDCRERRTE
jgi:hypothetical protein